MTLSASDLLKAARGIIEKGFCQWRGWDEHGGKCTARAFNTASRKLGLVSGSWQFLTQAAEEMGYYDAHLRYPESGWSVMALPAPVVLNNLTDKPTVLRMFDRAIELAEAREAGEELNRLIAADRQVVLVNPEAPGAPGSLPTTAHSLSTPAPPAEDRRSAVLVLRS